MPTDTIQRGLKI